MYGRKIEMPMKSIHTVNIVKYMRWDISNKFIFIINIENIQLIHTCIVILQMHAEIKEIKRTEIRKLGLQIKLNWNE